MLERGDARADVVGRDLRMPVDAHDDLARRVPDQQVERSPRGPVGILEEAEPALGPGGRGPADDLEGFVVDRQSAIRISTRCSG